MDPKPEYEIEVIQKLIDHELALSRLYEAYSRRFPEIGLWSELTEAEKHHARWLEALTRKVREGSVYFGKRTFNVQAIETSIDYLDREREKAGTRETTLVKALSTAASIEKAILERGWLESLEADSPALKEVLDRLLEDTRIHQHSVELAWARRRPS